MVVGGKLTDPIADPYHAIDDLNSLHVQQPRAPNLALTV
jgi:hypothetical protein